MTRWEPGAPDRLRAAALELFADQGFERTTAAEIATRAGVSERTFFRHFADKREVLFSGQEQFRRLFLDAVETAPDGLAPMPLMAQMLAASTAFFPETRREESRRRWAVISAHAALRERELLKLAALAEAVAAALRERGTAEPAATLAAESAITVFRVAFDRWLADDETRPLGDLLETGLADLAALAALAAPADPRPGTRRS